MLKRWLGFSLLLTEKMQGERDKSKELLKKKKESDSEDLENSKPTHIAKLEEACSENTKDVAEQPSDEAIRMGVNHTFTPPSQTKPGLYQQEHCRLGQKETEKKQQNEGRRQAYIIIQEKGRMTPEVIQRSSGLPFPPLPQKVRLLPLQIQKTGPPLQLRGAGESCVGGALAESQGRREDTGHPEEPRGATTSPVGLGGTALNQRGSFLNLKI